jgi:hypothetical protein
VWVCGRAPHNEASLLKVAAVRSNYRCSCRRTGRMWRV